MKTVSINFRTKIVDVFVVKFYRPERWTADQILEEHQFALQLVNDEVPVAAPVAF